MEKFFESNATVQAYEKMGAEYASSKHKTVESFNLVQERFVKQLILNAQDRLNIPIKDIKLLNVGSGASGNTRITTGFLNIENNRIALDPRNITYLDIAESALKSNRDGLLDTLASMGAWGDDAQFAGMHIVANAEQLPVKNESQHIVMSALCDHVMDQEKMYQEAMRTLVPGGSFITTYPAKMLNATIRENIYRIDSRYTRFIVDGHEHLVPSKLMMPGELESIYAQAGFVNVQINDIYHDSKDPCQKLSPTILDALKILGRTSDEVPILISGFGQKPFEK